MTGPWALRGARKARKSFDKGVSQASRWLTVALGYLACTWASLPEGRGEHPAGSGPCADRHRFPHSLRASKVLARQGCCARHSLPFLFIVLLINAAGVRLLFYELVQSELVT